MRRWIKEFFRLESASGLILIAASVVALMIANSPLGDLYAGAMHWHLPKVPLGPWSLDLSLHHFINDGLMALFFLVVACEIKREMLGGQLSNPRSLILPLVCAVAGVALPALIFTALNHHDAGLMRGWAVPTATDIAFALGMLALLGSRIPIGMKLLLSTVAVIDDLIAIVIIAVFYTAEMHSTSLVLSLVIIFAMFILNRLKVMNLIPYLALFAVLWVLVLKSGVHATLAGVVTGLLIPHRTGDDDTPDPDSSPSPLLRLEDDLHPWVAYLILPLFAFANAGLNLSNTPLSAMKSSLPMGIILGLIVGKSVGIFSAAFIAQKAGAADYPQGVTHRGMFGMSMLCGIGFTMSLFIAGLAYKDPLHYNEAVLGVFTASVIAAVLGLGWLRWCMREHHHD